MRQIKAILEYTKLLAQLNYKKVLKSCKIFTRIINLLILEDYNFYNFNKILLYLINQTFNEGFKYLNNAR